MSARSQHVNLKTRRAIALVMVVAGLAAGGGALAGPLNPPAGPVSSTGKTTQEIYDHIDAAVGGLGALEPRIAINLANTPGDADSVFKITQPGSYYLTSNPALVGGKSFIKIAANNVTVDLNGFTLDGAFQALDGVTASDTFLRGITIRNGHITAVTRDGVGGSASVAVEGVDVYSVLRYGFNVGADSALWHCVARSAGSDGFRVGQATHLDHCATYFSTGAGISTGSPSVRVSNHISDADAGGGILLSANATVVACQVGNGGSAGAALNIRGIAVGASSRVDGCTVYSMKRGILTASAAIEGDTNCSITNCDVVSFSTHTISCIRIQSGTVEHNTLRVCSDSGGIGINVLSTEGTSVRGNTITPVVANAGTAIVSAGRCFIECNSIFQTNVGVQLNATTQNVVVKNRIMFTATPVNGVAASNQIGPSLGVGAVNTNPHCNYVD